MTQASATLALPESGPMLFRANGSAVFAAIILAVMLAAALLAGAVPIGFSIVTVFLFAGPHNWVEFRYFLSKMPAHWGPLRGYFLLAIGGVVLLTAGFAAIPYFGNAARWDAPEWGMASAVWNTLLLAWVATLTTLRSRQIRRNGSWVIPAALLLVALVWLMPQAWDVALVYLHPLIALLFLDRELGRRRPQWRGVYRLCLLGVPISLALLWWKLSDASPLVGQDMLTMRITRHAGADVLAGVSPHLLVSTHTFLEMLHYGVWLVGMPLIALRSAPWRLQSAPLARRSHGWRIIVTMAIAAGAILVLSLWASFLTNYAVTRDVYFTLAIAHVLAEFPFLLRTF